MTAKIISIPAGRIAVVLGTVLLCGLFLGCFTSEPARFYRLRPLGVPPEASDSSTEPIRVLMGPVSVARYLARPQIAMRGGEHEIRYSEFSRWAGPLDRDIAAVLARNLSVLLASEEVYMFPPKAQIAADFQVIVSVWEMDAAPGGTARLEVRWAVVKGGHEEALLTRTSSHERPVASGTGEDMVHAYSELLADLSREIVDTLLNLASRGDL